MANWMDNWTPSEKPYRDRTNLEHFEEALGQHNWAMDKQINAGLDFGPDSSEYREAFAEAQQRREELSKVVHNRGNEIFNEFKEMQQQVPTRTVEDRDIDVAEDRSYLAQHLRHERSAPELDRGR